MRIAAAHHCQAFIEGKSRTVFRRINDDFACFINISIGAVFFLHNCQTIGEGFCLLKLQRNHNLALSIHIAHIIFFIPNRRQTFGKEIYIKINKGNDGIAFPVNGTIAKAVFRISAN